MHAETSAGFGDGKKNIFTKKSFFGDTVWWYHRLCFGRTEQMGHVIESRQVIWKVVVFIFYKIFSSSFLYSYQLRTFFEWKKPSGNP
jgi:hypothetical protein